MTRASRDFQIFAKPAGSLCNLSCGYCYYGKTAHLYARGESFRMPEDILEEYIVQHIEAAPGPVVNFSWHGGEPTILGVEYFRKIVALQRKHRPPQRRIINGMQTNGTLLDENWCRFLATEGFTVGISLDGPQELHDFYRVTTGGSPTFQEAMRGYRLLQQYRIPSHVLCVVHTENVRHPTEVYRFFNDLEARSIEFLPLVEPQPNHQPGVTPRTVDAEALGAFLCTVFDEWMCHDIERIHVQIFDEIARTALGQEHALCIFRKTCGDVPVIEHNGDLFSCDHFVRPDHLLGNIREKRFVDLLESPAQKAFGRAKWDGLPSYCRRCRVLEFCYGGCPKDRIVLAPDGEPGLNYLCRGYKQLFQHCQGFAAELSALGRRPFPEKEGGPASTGAAPARGIPRPGRNDPCPCGSGKKYKKCCLGK